MNEYWPVVVLLLAVASGFVLWSVICPVAPSLQQLDAHRAKNLALFQQQCKDLQAELDAGNLSTTEYAARTLELERALYDDLTTQERQADRPHSRHNGVYLLLIGALLIPVSGWLLYAELGASRGMQQRENMLATRALVKAAPTMEQLLVDLSAHLQDNPNNPEGWFLLANYYLQNQQWQEGLAAFGQAQQYALPESPERAAILGQLAQALFFIDGTFSNRVNAAIAEAIAVDSGNVPALSLMGMRAFAADQFSDAIGFWQQALAGATNGASAQSLRASISDAHRQLALQQGISAAEPVLEVAIDLANGLPLPTDSTTALFVYARQAGQSMPLLLARLDPQVLPTRVTLTNAMTLQPGIDLANFAELDIIAHIARAGEPEPQAGDLVGQVNSVSVAAQEVVDLSINRIVSGQASGPAP